MSLDHVHLAISELYPEMRLPNDYVWIETYDAAGNPMGPEMSYWDAIKAGEPIETAMPRIIAKCDEIAVRPAPVPATVTFRQLVRGLRADGLITASEAEAWAARNALPALLVSVIDALPTEDERVDARITVQTMTEVDRHDPLLAAVAAAGGLSDGDVDTCFRNWSAL